MPKIERHPAHYPPALKFELEPLADCEHPSCRAPFGVACLKVITIEDYAFVCLECLDVARSELAALADDQKRRKVTQ